MLSRFKEMIRGASNVQQAHEEKTSSRGNNGGEESLDEEMFKKLNNFKTFLFTLENKYPEYKFSKTPLALELERMSQNAAFGQIMILTLIAKYMEVWSECQNKNCYSLLLDKVSDDIRPSLMNLNQEISPKWHVTQTLTSFECFTIIKYIIYFYSRGNYQRGDKDAIAKGEVWLTTAEAEFGLVRTVKQ